MTNENKLIADFMKVELGTPYMWRIGAYTELTEEHLQYNTNWSWLMQAIDKIEMLEKGKYMLNYIYDELPEPVGFSCHWFTLDANDEILMHLNDKRFITKIEAAYDAVIEFIKYYNGFNESS